MSSPAEASVADLSQVGADTYTWVSVVEVVIAGLFQNQLYATVDDLGTLWIMGPNVVLDPIINPLFVICDGVDGTVDRSVPAGPVAMVATGATVPGPERAPPPARVGPEIRTATRDSPAPPARLASSQPARSSSSV